MLHEEIVSCPYCGEQFTAFIDLSQGDHHTIEDCWVCCRPIEFYIEANEKGLNSVMLLTGDE